MTSLALCRASSKMSIMPSVATRRSDTKVLLNLKRNTPGRSPFERLKPVHPKGCTSSAANHIRLIATELGMAKKVLLRRAIQGCGLLVIVLETHALLTQRSRGDGSQAMARLHDLPG